jgi:hypothetical protein
MTMGTEGLGMVGIGYGPCGGILGLAGAVAMYNFGMFTLHCVPVRGRITFYISLFFYPVSLLFLISQELLDSPFLRRVLRTCPSDESRLRPKWLDGASPISTYL